MSLTAQDLDQIRNLFIEGITELILPRLDRLEERLDRLEARVAGLEIQQQETNRRLDTIENHLITTDGRLKAIENDIKELYHRLKNQSHPVIGTKQYQVLADDKKLLLLDNAVQALAKHLHVSLSR